MCQLLGLNARKPVRLDFSLAGFLRRGGETDEHADGWGAAFFGDNGCRLLIDEEPSARSLLARLVQRNPTPARNAIVHIRKATQGAVQVNNCHPFLRWLWGREWAFAHNGNLERAGLPMPRRYRPLGETDSELAFCIILDAMRERFGETEPDRIEFMLALDEIGEELGRHGSFNFMLSDGHLLFARCATQLHYVQRAFPFGRARLLDCPHEIEFGAHNHDDDRMVLVATRPLTDEAWQAIPQGRLMAFAEGEPVPA